MVRHAIVDMVTNIVINVIEYETEISGTPPGMPDYYEAVVSDTAQIGWAYSNGVFINPTKPPMGSPEWDWGSKFVDVMERPNNVR